MLYKVDVSEEIIAVRLFKNEKLCYNEHIRMVK